MKIFRPLILTALLGLAVTTPLYAAEKSDVLTALQTARGKLVELTDTTDKGGQNILITEIHAATAETDKFTQEILSNPHTTPEEKKQIEDFDAIWTEFKNTRETEIIPDILAGKIDEAKALATGIQAKRMRDMLELLQ